MYRINGRKVNRIITAKHIMPTSMLTWLQGNSYASLSIRSEMFSTRFFHVHLHSLEPLAYTGVGL